jgi:hypothetical protein
MQNKVIMSKIYYTVACTVAMQRPRRINSDRRLDKLFPSATNMHATMEERCFLCGPCLEVITRTAGAWVGSWILQWRLGRDGQWCTTNPERTDVREETSDETWLQHRHNEPRLNEVATWWKRENIRQDLRENHWAGDREAHCRISRQHSKNMSGHYGGAPPPPPKRKIQHKKPYI